MFTPMRAHSNTHTYLMKRLALLVPSLLECAQDWRGLRQKPSSPSWSPFHSASPPFPFSLFFFTVGSFYPLIHPPAPHFLHSAQAQCTPLCAVRPSLLSPKQARFSVWVDLVRRYICSATHTIYYIHFMIVCKNCSRSHCDADGLCFCSVIWPPVNVCLISNVLLTILKLFNTKIIFFFKKDLNK